MKEGKYNYALCKVWSGLCLLFFQSFQTFQYSLEAFYKLTENQVDGTLSHNSNLAELKADLIDHSNAMQLSPSNIFSTSKASMQHFKISKLISSF